MRFDGRRLLAAMVPLLGLATAPPARAVILEVGPGWINSFYNSRCAGGPGMPVTMCTGFFPIQPQKPAQVLPFPPDGPIWPDHPTNFGWSMGNGPMPGITGQVLPFGPYQYHYINIHDLQAVGGRSHFRFAMRGGRNIFNLPALEIRALNIFPEGNVPPFPAPGKAVMQHNFSLDYPLTNTGNPPFFMRTRFFPYVVLRGVTSYARFSFQLRFYRVENPNVGPDEYLSGVTIDQTWTAPPFIHTIPIAPPDWPIGSIATGGPNTTLRMTGHVRLEGDPAEVFISDRSDPLGPRDVQCYDMKPASSLRANVDLADGFGTASVRLTGPDLMCAPANVNGGDPDAAGRPEHLTGYRSKFRFARLRAVPVQNLLGGGTVDVIRPDRLLVPTAKSLAPPPPAPLPQPTPVSYQCYRVRLTPGTPVGPFTPVEVEDQFGAASVTPRRPFRLCLPVNVNNEDPAAVAQPPILCYRTVRTPFERQTVSLTDRFRSADSRLLRRKHLCVESVIAGP
jgi:hypothetical protein